MAFRPGSLGATLLSTAALIGGAALVGSIARPSGESPVVRAAVVAPTTRVTAPEDEPTTWALRTNGWYIRVDGADIEVPAFAGEVEAQVTDPSSPSRSYSISPFDHLIVYHARAEGFDWRLVAAVVFEESRFDPNSRSAKGAVGLMQVRPIAAEAVGESEFRAPEDNVRAGVRYLRQLDELFAEASGRDRLGLVLAAYNVGPGHIRDAQVVARRLGFNPNRWFGHLDSILPLLEDERVYRDLPNGYAKGRDAVTYVQRIFERYRHYQIESAAANLSPPALPERPRRIQ